MGKHDSGDEEDHDSSDEDSGDEDDHQTEGAGKLPANKKQPKKHQKPKTFKALLYRVLYELNKKRPPIARNFAKPLTTSKSILELLVILLLSIGAVGGTMAYVFFLKKWLNKNYGLKETTAKEASNPPDNTAAI